MPRLKRVRNEMGLTNVEIMVPFVRTWRSQPGRRPAGRKRPEAGENGLRVIMMCECRPTPCWPKSS
jgi:pyruvate,water dikinase